MASWLLLCWAFFALLSVHCFALNKIQQGQFIKDDGGGNLTSLGQAFILGFFSPNGTTDRYVGVWYNRISPLSVVWVANRDRPIQDKNGSFGLTQTGNFVVLDGNKQSVWSTNGSFMTSGDIWMDLKDSGDAVIYNDNKRNLIVLWESFYHPTDTFLPGMRVNVSEGESQVFTCWTSPNNPSPGRFSMGIDPRASPQIVMWEGKKRVWRSGHWNGVQFLGIHIRTHYLYGFKLYTNDGVYFKYTPPESEIIKFKIDWEGRIWEDKWSESLRGWSNIQTLPSTDCESYNRCGQYATCDSSAQEVCSCILGFMAIEVGNWPKGCVRKTELKCQDVFSEVKDIKLPDFADIHSDARTPDQCRRKCVEDCTCTAYAPFVDGIPCMLWRGELVDMEQFDQGGGNSLFVRLANLESGDKSSKGKSKTTIIVALTVVAAVVVLVTISIGSWILYNRRAKIRAKNKDENPLIELTSRGESSTAGLSSDLVFFSLSSVQEATNHFSSENKLGQGGYGPVYKGTLPTGEEIAVKRLSVMSRQGEEEFMNELKVIANLQHKNLVRLLGCCTEEAEKMLIYEYLPNKSLDCFLFDSAKQAELNWEKRFQIIKEIARGILYLHRDSRLRIIHRDLKISNILLDAEMNPKISDFGMARVFGVNQSEAKSNVAGTRGYMAPEYFRHGILSTKSDVYSFGIMILEIVSGRKNASFLTDTQDITHYACDQWEQGTLVNLMDPSVISSSGSSSVPQQISRCINIGLLCLEQSADHRPDISTVVLYLESDELALPVPRLHTQASSGRISIGNQSGDAPCSNTMSRSEIEGR